MSQKKSQVEKFREAARELEADDSEKRFNEKLGKIARQKPSEPETKKSKTGKYPALFTFQTLEGLNPLGRVGIVGKGAVGGTRTHILPITNRVLFALTRRSSSATTAKTPPRSGNRNGASAFRSREDRDSPIANIRPEGIHLKREIALSLHLGVGSA
jgi:hypothetical protein